MLVTFETLTGEQIGMNPHYIKSIIPMGAPKTTIVTHFGDRMALCETVVKGTFTETSMKILKTGGKNA